MGYRLFFILKNELGLEKERVILSSIIYHIIPWTMCNKREREGQIKD